MLSAMPLVVTTLDDVVDDSDGQLSLREAIIAANETPGLDVIHFAPGLTGTIELSEPLTITDDLKIRGPGADRLAISGVEQTRVFAVFPAELADDPFRTPTPEQLAAAPEATIQGITIQDGRATDALGFDPTNDETAVFAFGAGLYNMGGDVRLDGVHFVANTLANAVTAGAAVANEFGGTLTVSHSHFEGNVSSGALIGVGGAITSDLGPTTEGVTGQPQVTILHSSFVNNVAQAAAGYLEGVPFSGLGGGGAILNVTGIMDVSHSRFEGNAAFGGTGGEGATSGGPAFGGAIISGDVSPFGIADSSLRVTSSRFVGNSATAGGGASDAISGGIAAGGAINMDNGTMGMLIGNLFEGNTVRGGGGGPAAPGGLATGGALATSGGAEVTMQRNRVVGNTAQGGNGGEDGNAAAGRGGGLGSHSIQLDGFFPGTAAVSSSSDWFSGNVAHGGIGGGIYNEGEMSVRGGRIVGNEAIGGSEVLIDFVPGYVFTGAALGGGISNLGMLRLHASTLQGNLAIGADDGVGPNVLVSPNSVATFPGLAVGAGLHNIDEATVTHTRIVGNQALGGDHNAGSFAGVANGGGIYSDGNLRLTHGYLGDNKAVGGNGNVGDISPGTGAGGGVTSGSVTALFGLRSASIVVERSVVTGNEAVGGNDNEPLFVVPPAHAPSAALGGGVLVYQGSADLSRLAITHNRAVGGNNGPAVGAGVFFFGLIGPVEAQLSDSLVAKNHAIGGNGEQGIGGGIAVGSQGSFFGGPVHLDVTRTLVVGNTVTGGETGDGLGGGIYNGEDGELRLAHSRVFRNIARGGDDGGEGRGGGLYNLGDVELVRSRIFANFASTDVELPGVRNLFG